jgi:hypothetical protein
MSGILYKVIVTRKVGKLRGHAMDISSSRCLVSKPVTEHVSNVMGRFAVG